MNVSDAILKRRSIRAFKPDPIPKEIITDIIEAALRSPSHSNTQPWELAVVSGKKLVEIKKAFIEQTGMAGDLHPNFDIPEPGHFPEPWASRRRACAGKMIEVQGIAREDRERRRWWLLQGLGLFGAPCVIYIYIDRSFYQKADGVDVWPVFDCGMIAQNILLMATSHGLGAIPQMEGVAYADYLRKSLNLPESKVFVINIAVGYPDWSKPINEIHTPREPFDSVVKWYGHE